MRYKVLLFFALFNIYHCAHHNTKCTYSSYGDDTDQSGIGKTCAFGDKVLITSQMKGDTFEITGFSSSEKQLVKTLWFKNKDTWFIPKEAFNTFPSLQAVAIIHTNLKVINETWLQNLLMFSEGRIKRLYFYDAKIDMIDPSVINIFKRMEYIKLNRNYCVKKDIVVTAQVDLISELIECFKNNTVLHKLINDVTVLNNQLETTQLKLSEKAEQKFEIVLIAQLIIFVMSLIVISGMARVCCRMRNIN
jgi:hypothetical protein